MISTSQKPVSLSCCTSVASSCCSVTGASLESELARTRPSRNSASTPRAHNRYLSTTSTSGYSPGMAANRSFEALSACTVKREACAAYGLSETSGLYAMPLKHADALFPFVSDAGSGRGHARVLFTPSTTTIRKRT